MSRRASPEVPSSGERRVSRRRRHVLAGTGPGLGGRISPPAASSRAAAEGPMPCRSTTVAPRARTSSWGSLSRRSTDSRSIARGLSEREFVVGPQVRGTTCLHHKAPSGLGACHETPDFPPGGTGHSPRSTWTSALSDAGGEVLLSQTLSPATSCTTSPLVSVLFDRSASITHDGTSFPAGPCT
jgi:hypothetical protein